MTREQFTNKIKEIFKLNNSGKFSNKLDFRNGIILTLSSRHDEVLIESEGISYKFDIREFEEITYSYLTDCLEVCFIFKNASELRSLMMGLL